MSELLRGLKLKHLPVDRSEAQRIVVHRNHVFEEALHRYKAGLNFDKYIKVTFVGEPAADEGGPLREFFNLLMSSISRNSNLFCGEEGSRTPQLNAVELSKKTYIRVGEMIATSWRPCSSLLFRGCDRLYLVWYGQASGHGQRCARPKCES